MANVRQPQQHKDPKTPLAPLGHFIGRTRFVVLLAVIAVLLVALSLFVLGTVMAMIGVGKAWIAVFSAGEEAPDLTVEFLELVTVMLKAVVFYLIAVGLYSLFIAPLNLPVALGVETLHDLETKIISVVIVIMAVEFLDHFIRWEDPAETLQYGAALAVTVAALVLFQFTTISPRRTRRKTSKNAPRRTCSKKTRSSTKSRRTMLQEHGTGHSDRARSRCARRIVTTTFNGGQSPPYSILNAPFPSPAGGEGEA